MYNGWSNRETWLVNIWFGDYFSELQCDGIEITPDLVEETVLDNLSQDLEGSSGFIEDLIDTSRFNYDELAEHFQD